MISFINVGIILLLTLLTACSRNDVVSCDSESIRQLEKTFHFDVDEMKDFTVLNKMDLSHCISNAFSKAHERKIRGANYDVIPVYCSVFNKECAQKSSKPKKNGFCISITGFGRRYAWGRDEGDYLSYIWLAVERSGLKNSAYEIVFVPFKYIIHGYTGTWTSYNFGCYEYRCRDPYLGWGDEDLVWSEIVARGERKIYLLLDGGLNWVDGCGRRVYENGEWIKRVNRMKQAGVLIELVPILNSASGCMLGCR